NVVGTHTYSAEGLFALTVKIKDVGGSSVTAGGTAQVTDAPPIPLPPPPAPTAFQGFPTGTLSLARFTFPGGLETGPNEYSATISWGDGSPQDTGTLVVVGSALYVTGGHSYGAGGTFQVT